MLNLEQAIADWRQRMLAAGIKTPALLDELENHLRDEIAHQLKSGLGEERAFKISVQQIGSSGALKNEFAKAGETKWAFLRRWKAVLFAREGIPFPSLEDFAPTAQHTLELAPGEARSFHHDFIGTEHVLLGLTRSESKTVSNVMGRLGLSSEAVRREIEIIVTNGPTHEIAAKIPFTPRARRAIQLAADEARKLNQPRINAEHIFLGLILEGSGVAAVVLKNLGVQLEKAREEILKEMQANPGAA